MSPEDTKSCATAALRAVDLTVRYGGVVANNAVNLEVRPGQVVGLIGPNGAGKTTFIDAVSGFTSCSGQVWVDEVRVDGLPPHRRRKLGLARTWQAGELFAELTVAENLVVAFEGFGLRTMARDLMRLGNTKADARVMPTLAAVGLGDDVAPRRPGELSLADQKLVGVARALAGNSRVLLLDEPAAGLDTEHTRRLGKQLASVAQTGVSTLLVDHDMAFVLDACDHIYVLDFGHVIASGPPAQIKVNEDVIAAYLGTAEVEEMAQP